MTTSDLRIATSVINAMVKLGDFDGAIESLTSLIYQINKTGSDDMKRYTRKLQTVLSDLYYAKNNK